MMLPQSRWLLVYLGVALAADANRARAYGDPYRFNDPAILGGGGGRWFTGSPADGYKCDVCHDGEEANEVVVRGLPARYELGVSYDIWVEWPASIPNVTALVEITDGRGHGVGTAALSSLPLSAAETCQPVEAGVPAALLLSAPELDLADGRQVVGMQDCGGSVLHWQWTAPAQDYGAVTFAGGLVAPDNRDDVQGDRVAAMFRWIGSPSEPVHTDRIYSGCSLTAGPRRVDGSTVAWQTALCGAACLRRRVRRRRTRKARPPPPTWLTAL